ncbi:MAG: RsmD family RNA methyltransferase [Thermofilaceae archaeon]|nr:RsmD family RNA methyltransferase [Thermofilaceae archaeon]MCX8181202.1 RsmD family RNA methyltransferase [Thermofilaceae archaeon]
MREVENIINGSLEKLSPRIALLPIRSENLRELLAKLYDCVLLQEVIIAKTWIKSTSSDPKFYYDLATKCEWIEVKGKSFAVSVRKIGGYPSTSSIMLAASVAEAVRVKCGNSCTVNLKDPNVHVRILTSPDAVVIGIRVLDPRGDRYRFRSKRYKVFRHPAAITPEDAGIMVNLTGRTSPLLDPFCGSGTIIIEACKRGIEAVGVDVNSAIARGAAQNLKRFSCDSHGHIIVGNFSMLPFRPSSFTAISTNPPYGRIMKTREGENIVFEELTRTATGIVKKSGKIVFVKPLEGSHPVGEKIEYHYVYVHGGLTRVFCVTRVDPDAEW